MEVTFWGVRGSVPAPLTGNQVEEKMKVLFKEFMSSGRSDWEAFLAEQPFWKRSTYGGNTSCVEVVCGSGTTNKRIVLDMGTGLRVLGTALFPEMLKNGGLDITFLLSHVHWDHIQGLPFFGPLYVNKESRIKNHWSFYGGTDWMRNAEVCLGGQMDEPVFPVSWEEIAKITHRLETTGVYDQMRFAIGDTVSVRARKLNHPQETYGWKIEDRYDGTVLVYATDNEPFDPNRPDPRLLDLAKDADFLIIDCQYAKDVYEGKVGGVPRHGWGHSYPEAVAQVAVQANVKQMALFHHDPASSDAAIAEMKFQTQQLIQKLGGDTKVLAAHEGLSVDVAPAEALLGAP